MWLKGSPVYRVLAVVVFAVPLAILLAYICVMLPAPTSPSTPSTERRFVTQTFTDASFPGQLRQSGEGWPACDASVQQWSGYYDLPGKAGAKHYFYWAFGPRNGNPHAPVILWMTGGPGCSSSFALLAELGPCQANETSGAIEHNPYAWNTEAYLLFVDQPAGVGFSHAEKADYDVNSHAVADDMYHFMQAFFTAHPSLRANELFVVGESYGGHYAPATAHRILMGNRRQDGPAIRLRGMSTGNGLTDPLTQYPAYSEMASTYCRERLGRSCVSAAGLEEMVAAEPRCRQLIEACNRNNGTAAADACRQAGWACNTILHVYSETGLNPYDIRLPCEGDLCYDFHAVDDFMNRADVQASLGVDPGTPWQSCNMEVNSMFGVDWFKNFSYTVPDLLEAGVRVMIYAGDLDFVCNWIGNARWTQALPWRGQERFQRSFDVPFRDDSGAVVGTVRAVSCDGNETASSGSSDCFSFVRVFDAGHMVPMDQPRAALRVINNFVFQRGFTP